MNQQSLLTEINSKAATNKQKRKRQQAGEKITKKE
jgi:hypothetical protein